MPQRRPNRFMGPGHDEFWSWCDRKELRLQQCEHCHRISWPPVEACSHCGGRGLVWQRMSGNGRVASWCTFERDYYGGVLPVPWDIILVQLDEDVLFVSNPLRFSWRDTALDLPVRVAFIDCEDAAGAFSLPVFERF